MYRNVKLNKMSKYDLSTQYSIDGINDHSLKQCYCINIVCTIQQQYKYKLL